MSRDASEADCADCGEELEPYPEGGWYHCHVCGSSNVEVVR